MIEMIEIVENVEMIEILEILEITYQISPIFKVIRRQLLASASV